MRVWPSGTRLARSLMPMGVPGGSAPIIIARPFAVRLISGCLDRWCPLTLNWDVCRTFTC